MLQLVYSVVGTSADGECGPACSNWKFSGIYEVRSVYVPAEEIESLMNEISGYELYAVSH